MLNDLIAKEVLSKPLKLKGDEIRFLRKNLRLPAKDFAEKLRVAITTYSKWENSKQTQGVMPDMHIRNTYILEKPLKHEDYVSFIASTSMGFDADLPESNIVAKRIEDKYIVFREPAISETLNPCVFFNLSENSMATPTLNFIKQMSDKVPVITGTLFPQQEPQANNGSFFIGSL
jgi:transcriptional regulator with XRE-family HTH domain